MGKIDEDYSETTIPNYDKPVIFIEKKLVEFIEEFGMVVCADTNKLANREIANFISKALQEQREEIYEELKQSISLKLGIASKMRGSANDGWNSAIKSVLDKLK